MDTTAHMHLCRFGGVATYLLAFHGGASAQHEEDSARLVAAWADWMGRLGPALRDPGGPARESRTVHADGSVTDGGGPNPVTGYITVDALDLDAAIALTVGCPIFHAHGSVEILEME